MVRREWKERKRWANISERTKEKERRRLKIEFLVRVGVTETRIVIYDQQGLELTAYHAYFQHGYR